MGILEGMNEQISNLRADLQGVRKGRDVAPMTFARIGALSERRRQAADLRERIAHAERERDWLTGKVREVEGLCGGPGRTGYRRNLETGAVTERTMSVKDRLEQASERNMGVRDTLGVWLRSLVADGRLTEAQAATVDVTPPKSDAAARARAAGHAHAQAVRAFRARVKRDVLAHTEGDNWVWEQGARGAWEGRGHKDGPLADQFADWVQSIAQRGGLPERLKGPVFARGYVRKHFEGAADG